MNAETRANKNLVYSIEVANAIIADKEKTIRELVEGIKTLQVGLAMSVGTENYHYRLASEMIDKAKAVTK